MQIRFAITACLAALLFSLAACVNPSLSRHGRHNENVPTPPRLYPFDVTKKGATIDEIFQIPKKRYWFFQIHLIFPDFDSTIHQLCDKVCYGPDESRIDISLQVFSINADGNEKMIYEGTTSTGECYAHYFETTSISEVIFERNVKVLLLDPGLYRFKAVTVRDNNFFKDLRSEFDVTYEPKY